MSDHPHVLFGKSKSLPVYPQPPKRITKRLGRIADAFDLDDTAEMSEEDIKRAVIGNLGNRIYYLFETFIPNISERLPEYMFWGYRDQAAFDDDDFDEDRDGEEAATFPQWLDAIDVIVDVNGGKRFLGLLGKVVPEMWVKAKIAELFEAGQEALERSNGSPNSRGENGESDPRNSGQSDPTSAERSPAPTSGNGSPTPTLIGSTPSV